MTTDRAYTLAELQTELVDLRGIGELLGLTYQSARTIVSRAEMSPGSEFPKHVLTIANSRVWLASAIKEWAAHHHRAGQGNKTQYPNLRDQLFNRYCVRKNGQPYLTPKELAEFLYMSTADMEAWRKVEYGPPYMKWRHDRGLSIRYPLDSLVEWFHEEKRHLERIRRGPKAGPPDPADWTRDRAEHRQPVDSGDLADAEPDHGGPSPRDCGYGYRMPASGTGGHGDRRPDRDHDRAQAARRTG